jgi:spoIIIJ-associated protein
VEHVEASGKSIEDAILQALARLGRNRDEVEITVLQQPSRGTRGMGAREARVRVFVKSPRGERAPRGAVQDVDDAGADLDAEEGELWDGDEYVNEEGRYHAAEGLTTAPLRDELPEDASIEEMAHAALRTILGHMGVQAEVDIVEVGPNESEEEPITLNIRSADPTSLSLLIGKRGETLSALQLLVNLMVAKQTGMHERIIVDAESYRERRERNLRAMAQRIAQQVRKSGHPVVLEAMPPNERRIIHLALAESDDISTESMGEGDQRRVVVSLKRGVRT